MLDLTANILTRWWMQCALLLFASTSLSAQSLPELMQEAAAFHYDDPGKSKVLYLYAAQIAEQETVTDSLYSIYSSLATLYNLENQSDSALYFAQQQYRYANDSLELGMSLLGLGMQYEKNDQYRADSCYFLAELIADGLQDSFLFAGVYSNYGQLKLIRGEFFEGVEYLIKATYYNKSEYATAQYYVKLANTFDFLDNIPRAEEYALKAIELCEKNHYKYGKGMPIITYAKVLQKQGFYTKSDSLIALAIQDAEQRDRPTALAAALVLATKSATSKNDLEAARKLNARAILLFGRLSTSTQTSLLNQQSYLFYRGGEYQKVLDNSQVVFGLFQDRVPRVAKQAAAFHAFQAYDAMGQPEKALEYHRAYVANLAAIFYARKNFNVAYVEAQYNRQAQSSAIALLDTQNELQAQQLDQQRKQLIGGGVALVIILGLLLFLFRFAHRIRKQNTIISKALSEKDILLREIHHRVKNNLQLVSSLLGLQSRYVDDPQAQRALTAGKSRVKSMSLIHQDLYSRENLTGVSVKEYFHKLCRELIATYQIDPGQIELESEIEDLQLDVDTLVPLGLIINELLTNALKYAFPDQQKGTIRVELYERAEELCLLVADNGVGISETNDKPDSFGYKLIQTLVDQLEGRIQRVQQDGTALQFTFCDYKIAN